MTDDDDTLPEPARRALAAGLDAAAALTTVTAHDARAPNRVYECAVAAPATGVDHADAAATPARYVLKYAADGDAARIAREAAVTARAHRIGCAPAVVATDDGDDATPPYLITRRVAGAPAADAWSDPPLALAGYRRLGRTLGRLHAATRTGACGLPVGGGAEGLALSPSGSWHRTLVALVERRVADLADTRFEALAADAAARIRSATWIDRGARPALIHNDPGPYNHFPDAGVLIDWELALRGDGAYDVAWIEGAVRDGPADPASAATALAALRTGYREHATLGADYERRRAAYRLVRMLRTLRTFDSWGPAVAAATDRDLSAVTATVRDRVRERLAAVPAPPED